MCSLCMYLSTYRTISSVRSLASDLVDLMYLLHIQLPHASKVYEIVSSVIVYVLHESTIPQIARFRTEKKKGGAMPC